MNDRLKILIVIAVVLSAFVLSGYLDSATQALRQEGTENQVKLSRYMRLYKRHETFKDIYKTVKDRFTEVKDKLIVVADISEGFITFQRQIKRATKEADLSIRSINAMEVEDKDGMQVFPVRVTLQGSMAGLNSFFNHLYSGNLIVGIESIQITRARQAGYIMAQMILQTYGLKKEGT